MNKNDLLDDQKKYCTFLISMYMQKHNISYEDMYMLMPSSFLALDDYDYKIRILVEALNNNILIEETKLYGEMSSGVQRS